MKERVVKLDVRDEIKRGREPFSVIMSTVTRLKANESLLLIAPFEPVPLFSVLARHGFSHRARQTEPEKWEVLFQREPLDDSAAIRVKRREENVLELDARGLEPPQPLVSILEALGELPAQHELWARTDRRPLHLYPQLESRGFSSRSEEQADGTFVTYIRRQ